MSNVPNEPASIAVSLAVPPNAPQELREELLREARRRIGLALYPFLLRQKNPVVLHWDETTYFPSSQTILSFKGQGDGFASRAGYGYIEIRVWATAVEFEHVRLFTSSFTQTEIVDGEIQQSGWETIKEFVRHITRRSK